MTGIDAVQQTTREAEIEALWVQLYPDLKQMARARLRRSGADPLLETTGLVNEAFVRLSGAVSLRDASPGPFMACASRAMRSVVVDLIRERQSLRRGGDVEKVTLNTVALNHAAPPDGGPDWAADPLRIDEALRTLAVLEPRLCQVVEMRFFAAFTETEIGDALGVTSRTVRRDLTKASLLLRAMLSTED